MVSEVKRHNIPIKWALFKLNQFRVVLANTAGWRWSRGSVNDTPAVDYTLRNSMGTQVGTMTQLITGISGAESI